MLTVRNNPAGRAIWAGRARGREKIQGHGVGWARGAEATDAEPLPVQRHRYHHREARCQRLVAHGAAHRPGAGLHVGQAAATGAGAAVVAAAVVDHGEREAGHRRHLHRDRGGVGVLHHVVQGLLVDEVNVVEQRRCQRRVGQVGGHAEAHVEAGGGQHLLGVVAHSVQQLAQAQRAGIKAPHYVAHLLGSLARGDGQGVEPGPGLGRAVRCFAQQVAVHADLGEQVAHVVVQVGRDTLAQVVFGLPVLLAPLAAAPLPPVHPADRRRHQQAREGGPHAGPAPPVGARPHRHAQPVAGGRAQFGFTPDFERVIARLQPLQA